MSTTGMTHSWAADGAGCAVDGEDLAVADVDQGTGKAEHGRDALLAGEDRGMR